MTRLIRPIGLTITLAAALLLLASPAPAVERDPCAAAIGWAEQIVASTQLPPPVGWTVVYECGPHDGMLGYADRPTRTVTIWTGATDRPSWLAWAYVHETAHAYDFALLEPDDQALWRGARGISPDPDWWGPREVSAEEWAALPSEDFAEVFAACWLGELPPDWPWRVSHAGPPGDAECQVMQVLTGLTRAVE